MRKLSLFLIILLLSTSLHALDCFPGAEGFGTDTVGGRYGTPTVYKVTNLNNSGAGSFRAACEASGARFVVFMVSGDIHLTDFLYIENPYITIAGQTSPGGISISGKMFIIATHDVVMTHVRIRKGTDLCADDCDGYNCSCESGYGDSLRIMNNGSSPGYNVVIDHCSITWGADETLDISSYDGGTTGYTYNVTVSNCLIGQACNGPDTGMETNHAYGFLISGVHQPSPINPTHPLTVTVHHNYIMHAIYRMPIAGAAYLDMYNNVCYNWYDFNFLAQRYPTQYMDTLVNSRHNYYKVGPSIGTDDDCDSAANKSIGVYQMDYDAGAANQCLTGTPSPKVYTKGNLGCSSLGTNNDDKMATCNFSDDWPWLASGWLATSPISAATTGDATVTTMNATYAGTVVSASGANKVAGTGSPTTLVDSVDTQLIADYSAGTGTWLTSTNYPTGWPTYSTANDNPTDSDSDGMIDATEVTLWGNKEAHAATDSLSSGYLAIEEYIFYLGGYQDAETPSAVRGTSGAVTIRNGTFHP